MSVATFEGIVEDGQIRLKGDVRLPGKAKVYVLVPEMPVRPIARVMTSRLAHPEHSTDFTLVVSEEVADAGGYYH
jgi:hypothetical protein